MERSSVLGPDPARIYVHGRNGYGVLAAPSGDGGNAMEQVIRQNTQTLGLVILLGSVGLRGAPSWTFFRALGCIDPTFIYDASGVPYFQIACQLTQILISIGLLVLTEILYRFTNVPGFDQAFVDQHNFGNYMDLLLMNKINAGGWVAINCLPTAAHTIWGALAGKLLLSDAHGAGKSEKACYCRRGRIDHRIRNGLYNYSDHQTNCYQFFRIWLREVGVFSL